MLFENVIVEIKDNKYFLTVSEYPNISKIYFVNNERLKDDELKEYADQLDLKNLNPLSINEYIDELNNLYESFGYNNIDISYSEKFYSKTNTADLTFEINEGEITRIKSILFSGNEKLDNDELRSVIKSKTKTLINLFAKKNFKKFVVENDTRKIKKYYKNKGFVDAQVNYRIEFQI